MAEEPQHPGATEGQTSGFHPAFSMEAALRAQWELVEKGPSDAHLELRQRCLNSSPDLPVTGIPAGALPHRKHCKSLGSSLPIPEHSHMGRGAKRREHPRSSR